LGDLDGASALLEESLGLYQKTGTLGGTAYVLLHLGGVARGRQDAARAQSLFEESLTLYTALGDRSDVAYATSALSALAADGGDLERARALCEEAIALFRHLDDVRGLVEGLRVLGRIATLQTDDPGAIEAYAECVALRHALRNVDVAFCLEGLALAQARIAARQHDSARMYSAVRLLGAAAALRATHGATTTQNWSVALPETTHREYSEQVAATRAALGDAQFESAWAAGQRLNSV
jgi:tetratricopeptide (TPR) repeat protein